MYDSSFPKKWVVYIVFMFCMCALIGKVLPGLLFVTVIPPNEEAEGVSL